MSGSGTNRTVQSLIEGKRGSQSVLTKALENANEVAARDEDQAPKGSKKMPSVVQKKVK